MNRKCHGVQKQTEDTNAGVGAGWGPRGLRVVVDQLPQNIEATAVLSTQLCQLFFSFSPILVSFTAYFEGPPPRSGTTAEAYTSECILQKRDVFWNAGTTAEA